MQQPTNYLRVIDYEHDAGYRYEQNKCQRGSKMEGLLLSYEITLNEPLIMINGTSTNITFGE